MSAEKEQIQYFSSEKDGMMVKIIVCSLVFHAALIVGLYILHCMDSKPEPEMIPIFEMVQVAPPLPEQPEEVKEPEPEKQPEPPKEEPKPVEEPEPVPETKPELPPEPKPEVKPEPPKEEVKEPEVKPEPPKVEPKPVEKKPKKEVKRPKRVDPDDDFDDDDFPLDDMDLPKSFESSTLKPVGNVEMDPLMRAYLERLKQIIMSNFNPPGGLEVARGSKTTVQFSVNTNGRITGVLLKRSSGNGTWDHLSVRAVQISKVPGLPPSYDESSLVLHFNFTPN